MAQVNMNFPSNSDRSREITTRPPAEAIVRSSNVTSAQNTFGRKLVRAFISSDATNIKDYILCDVIIPTIKNTIVDVVEMTFFGNSSGRRGRSYGGYGGSYYNYARVNQNVYSSRTSYGGYSSQSNSSGQNAQPMTQEADLPDYREIVITGPNDRHEAERIITEMRNDIEQYGCARVADLYRRVGMTPDFTKENWGWDGDPYQIGTRRVNGGWLIVVPDAKPIY